MSLLVDPSICPDCRAQVSAAARCTGCGLDLSGAPGQEVWGHLVAADAVIRRIRSVQEPAPPAAAARPTPLPARPRLPGRAVPALLLGLGGLFVLVAVSLFLAVTWNVLPLGAKAVIMGAVTTALGAIAVVLTRRALRASAEALWALTAALLALDLGAAWRAGFLGLDAVPDRPMRTVVGLALVALGLAVATWARRTPLRRSVAGEVTLGAGIATLVGSEVLAGAGSDGVRLVAGVAALGVAAALLRHRWRELALLTLAAAVLVWLDLVTIGADPVAGRGAYWSGLAAWRLVAAAALAAVPALLTRIPGRPRTAAATAVLGCLGLAAVQPIDGRSSLQVLLVVAVLAAYALIGLLALRPWSGAAALLGAMAAAGVAAVLIVAPATGVLAFVAGHRTWTTSGGTRFPTFDGPGAWTLALLVAVATAAVAVAARHLVAPARQWTEQALLLALPGSAMLTVTTIAAGSRMPVAVVTAGLVATALSVLAVPARRPAAAVPAAVIAVEAAGLALLLGTRSDLLGAFVATVLAAAAGVGHLRDSDRAYGVTLVPLAAGAAYAWGRVADLGPTPRLVVVLVVTAVGLLLAALRHRPGAVAVEVAAGLCLVPEALSAVASPVQFALALTLAGSALALSSVVRLDRTEVGWLAGAVLFGATLVRVTTDQPSAPELYALPAAVLLIVAGAVRLRTAPALGSWRMLGTGLDLALLPSLLIALSDPASLRGLLVGLGAALSLVIGLRSRWQAPYLVGTGVLAVLALRFLLPLAADVLADPVGAWLLFGAAGALLLAAGVTWERSVRRLRSASRHVAALV